MHKVSDHLSGCAVCMDSFDFASDVARSIGAYILVVSGGCFGGDILVNASAFFRHIVKGEEI